jgi:hypothetical protein
MRIAVSSGMATLLMLILIVGYAWSVWSLKRQEHFDERPPRKWRFSRAHLAPPTAALHPPQGRAS